MIDEERARLGRPPLPPEQAKGTGTMRLTADRWAKLRRLGAAWRSKAIDRAKEPKE
jgi:hypothetical protein